jgi:hypothetical protein
VSGADERGLTSASGAIRPLAAGGSRVDWPQMTRRTLSILATGLALAGMDGCAASEASPRTEAVLTPVSPPPARVSPAPEQAAPTVSRPQPAVPPVSPPPQTAKLGVQGPPDPPPARPTTDGNQIISLLNASAAGAGTAAGSDAFGAGGLGTPARPATPAGAPHIREGKATVTGGLASEVIQRIVRQNFGRFRLCYENGLKKTPALAGQVGVHFVIDASGSVSQAERDPTTTMTDGDVVSCVMRSVATLSFPQPQGGPVDVVYPLMFSP